MKLKSPALFIACFITIFCSQAFASLRGNANVMSESLKYIKEKASSGDAYYQGVLGILYRTGEKVDFISQNNAAEWTMKSAEQGHPLGYANQGVIAMQTNFPALAKKHFEQAMEADLKILASDGDPFANYCMAEIFSSASNKSSRSAQTEPSSALGQSHISWKSDWSVSSSE